MIDDEIIEVVQARKAGMRIQFFSQIMKDWLPATTPTWNFVEIRYRVHPADLPAWERIKGERLAEQVKPAPDLPKISPPMPGGWHGGKIGNPPDLPPLPEKDLVVLPKNLKRPKGVTIFDAWVLTKNSGYWDRRRGCYGPEASPFNRDNRYAVPTTSEIARLNGVGWGECPSRWGWHNPNDRAPEFIGVPSKRLLVRDEIGNRVKGCKHIEVWNPRTQTWDANKRGNGTFLTYRTSAPYGSLPPVTEHTFPECAPSSFTVRDDSPDPSEVVEREWVAKRTDDGVQWMNKDSTPPEIGWYYVHEKNGSVGSRYWEDLGGGVWWNSNARDGWTPNDSFIEWAYIPEIHAATKQAPKATPSMPGDWHQADLNKPDKGYGQDLDGKPLSPPSDRHEIIPVNTKVHPGEVTHFYFVGDHTAKWRSFLTDGPPTPIKENDGTSQVYEEDGNYILAYARLRYSVLHERSGIKPGDVVEVVRLAEHHERGWNHISPRIPQQSYVGHMGEVIEDCGSDDGFEIRFSDNYLMLAPAFVLRKVERVRVPLEASDWAGGPWTIFDTIANNTQLQELVIGVDKNGRIETKLDDYLPEEMKENCKRARGWPGDNLTFEGCWKWADESER